jgi:hypothetical protein
MAIEQVKEPLEHQWLDNPITGHDQYFVLSSDCLNYHGALSGSVCCTQLLGLVRVDDAFVFPANSFDYLPSHGSDNDDVV